MILTLSRTQPNALPKSICHAATPKPRLVKLKLRRPAREIRHRRRGPDGDVLS
jgi:hypothetical protein